MTTDIEDIEDIVAFCRSIMMPFTDPMGEMSSAAANTAHIKSTDSHAYYMIDWPPGNKEYDNYDNTEPQLNTSYQKQILVSCIKMHEFDSIHAQRSLFRLALAKYVYPFLLLFGIVGNLASFLAMLNKCKSEKSSPRKHLHTFSLCLAILCFADLVILIVGGLSEYLEQVFDVSMRASSVFACKFLYFTCYMFSSFVSYLYAFIAMDRWQAVAKPIEYKQKRTRRHHQHILAIFVYCFVLCTPFFYFPALNNASSMTSATFEPKCRLPVHLFRTLTLLDAIVYSFLPFVVTFGFSTLTLIQLVRERRQTKRAACAMLASRLSWQQNVCTSLLLKNTRTPFARRSVGVDFHVDGMCHTLRIAPINRSSISRWKLTLNLMTLPLSYLTSTLPLFVIILLQCVAPYIRKDLLFENEFALAYMLMYANNSFNILFFIMFGKNVRGDLVALFRRKKEHKRQRGSQRHDTFLVGSLFEIKVRVMRSANTSDEYVE